MPQIGEIQRLPRPNGRGTHKQIWQGCSMCGKERWVELIREGIPKYTMCHSCRQIGSNNSNWGGGRQKHNKGYIEIKLQPDDFFYPMAHQFGYVMEHRLVMARHLGRCLQGWEIVHHKNRIRNDNRIENLQLATDIGHQQLTRLEMYIDKLQKEIATLKQENKELRK